MRLIEEDAKKPKIERQFSFYNAETIRLNGNYERAQTNASNALKEEETIDMRLEQKKKHLAVATTQLLDAQSETITLNNALPALRSEKETLANENDELQRKNNDLLSLAQDYDLISNAIDEIAPKNEKIVKDYKSIINNVKKQIHDGLREFYSVMWGLEAWGKDKLKFSLFKKKMDGAPEDLKEFDERVEKLIRIATDETIDTFLDLDFAIPKKPIPQAFKEKVKALRADPARSERNAFVGKGINLDDKPTKIDNEKKINEAIARARIKPKV